MQTIINGIDNLKNVFATLNCKKIFLVAGNSYSSSCVKKHIDALNIEIVRFSDFKPNPVFEDVSNAVSFFKENECDAIVAVGGGSCIDVAKCVKLSVLADAGLQALIPPLVSERLPINGQLLPFVAIPTTAGSGSESTHNAVMYYQGAKQTVTNDEILPDYAILEPSVLDTLPLYQKKSAMLDALCQAIESWWSVNSTDESVGYSKQAVELIMKYWRRYIFDN